MKKPIDTAARFVRKHSGGFLLGVAVAVTSAGVTAVLGLNPGGDSSTTINSLEGKHKSTYGNQSDGIFTVKNDERRGVWALTSPVMRRFGNEDERPLNASRWLVNGTPVLVQCAETGTEYDVVINEEPTKWKFFAESKEGFYVPMAGFKQTISDGAQHLVPCQNDEG